MLDDRDAWSEHQPSSREENEFIGEHGWDEYGRWHLGVDDERPPEGDDAVGGRDTDLAVAVPS